MKKWIFILLFVTGCITYGYVFWQISYKGNTATISTPKIAYKKETAVKNFKTITPIYFKENGKSPFLAYSSDKKNQQTQVDSVASNLAQMHPPNIHINGIMWNATDPIAVISINNDKAICIKQNMVVDSILVINTIEQNKISITYKTKHFWIQK